VTYFQICPFLSGILDYHYLIILFFMPDTSIISSKGVMNEKDTANPYGTVQTSFMVQRVGRNAITTQA
jgi:hypothetical protein